MRCDDCKWYSWYYDLCQKWNIEVDWRGVYNCFEKRETPILDAMVNGCKLKHERASCFDHDRPYYKETGENV